MGRLLERFRYGLTAAKQSRGVSDNPLFRLFFFLAPEAIVERLAPSGRFLFSGFPFYSRRRDWGGVAQVLVHDEYGVLDRLLVKNARPTIVDLGANIGMFSLRVFSRCPLATVYAVEPSRATFDLLARNRLQNPRLTWELRQAAIWREDGPIQFVSNSLASTQSAIGKEGTERVEAVRVHTLLSTWVRAPVDLMKMDIEGAEEAAICEDETWLSQVPELLIQVHPDRCNHRRVVEVLQRHFTSVYRIPERSSPHPLVLASNREHPFPLWESVERAQPANRSRK